MARSSKLTPLKLLNIFCSFTLLIAVIYLFFAGFNWLAAGAITAALVGTAAPVVIGSDGIVEILFGIAEAIFEGIAVVVEGIFSVVSSLFSS
ncbi:MAG TPA: hypothetical protein VIC08_10780 [Cellvibrionaceae bacterium]